MNGFDDALGRARVDAEAARAEARQRARDRRRRELGRLEGVASDVTEIARRGVGHARHHGEPLLKSIWRTIKIVGLGVLVGGVGTAGYVALRKLPPREPPKKNKSTRRRKR